MGEFQKMAKKMHFLLSNMSVVYVLTTPMPEDGGENPTVEQVRRRAKWDNDDYVCRGLILNGMSHSLFDVYQNVETSKELRDTLEAKYMTKDASSKKFFVSCIIDKLSPSWKDFKHTLKHLKEKLTLIELVGHLRIEESFRVHDSDKPKGNNVAGPSVVNMVEYNNSSRYNTNKGKRKHHDTKTDPNKKPKVTCWKCEKPRHLKRDCKGGNVGNKANGSGTKCSGDGSSNPLKGQNMFNKSFQIYYVTYVSEVYFVQDDNVAWLPNKRNKITFYEIWTKKKPNLNYLKVWGCGTAVRLPDPKLKTLGERGHECIYVGYVEHSKAFRFYVTEPNDSFAINSIIESRDAIFDEHRFSSVPRPSQRSLKDGTKDSGGLVVSERVTEEKEAINNEMNFIMGNNTWVLTDLPPGCRPLGCKWIFKRKLKVDRTVKKFKARLVIECFKQKSGIDYFDTYALVARISTIRLLIAIASIHSMIIHQMDEKTAFLNGELEEEVDLTKEILSTMFYIKDMGEADVILGIRIEYESNGIAISQSHSIEKVLKKFNYSDCTPVSTPLDTCKKLMPNKGPVVSQLEYYEVIGCLMYAMTCTRLDIAFVVGKLSRYNSNPGTQHWQAIQRVLKYLKKTIDYKLVYSGYPSVLKGYNDASWINNTKENSSISGWVFLLGGGAIYWASKKQTCITGSTMESKFVALAAAGKEAEWLKNLLFEIPLWFKPMAPISIRCDSVATLAKAYSQMYNGKSRHLCVRHIMIHELIMNGVVSMEFVRSQQNLADHLMKGLARDLVIQSAEGMRLKSN
uniref:Zinc finger, CCHC-type n=1 Tax=Tanacetum cinerariifolium TaxID=118510 RepID=A0A699HXC4_TANCI|nr:zinc finger, CCHC-type [Tanacetum cinerariifolium]